MILVNNGLESERGQGGMWGSVLAFGGSE